jgi:hypothetical protein
MNYLCVCVPVRDCNVMQLVISYFFFACRSTLPNVCSCSPYMCVYQSWKFENCTFFFPSNYSFNYLYRHLQSEMRWQIRLLVLASIVSYYIYYRSGTHNHCFHLASKQDLLNIIIVFNSHKEQLSAGVDNAQYIMPCGNTINIICQAGHPLIHHSNPPSPDSLTHSLTSLLLIDTAQYSAQNWAEGQS